LQLIASPFWGFFGNSATFDRRKSARWAPAGDRFDSDCVVGTQFESYQAHHTVLRKRRFPGLVRIAPNWRRLVIGIVLASAAIITGMVRLVWFAGVLGVLGVVLTLLGLLAPHEVPIIAAL
jgi:hypothetical protein